MEGVTAIDRSKGLWSARNSWGRVNEEVASEYNGQVLTFNRRRKTHRYKKTVFTRCGGSHVSARQIMASSF